MMTLPKKFLSRYSHRARKVLIETLSRPGHPQAVDLLEVLINHEGALGAQLLAAYGITPAHVARLKDNKDLNEQKETAGPEEEGEHLSGQIKMLLKRATTLASQHNSIYIGTEHLLAALLEDKHMSKLLAAESSKRAMRQLQEHLLLLLSHTAELNHLTPSSAEEDVRENQTRGERRSQHMGTREDQRALPLFTEDMVEHAKEGLLDPLVGREEEVERLITILSRRTKNNPLLIGEAGVGKTAIVEGLAQRMHTGNVPEHLADKRLLALDLGLLIAGTVFRGEFEARLKDVIQEAEEERAILFIDEMHTLVGAGSAQGSLDAANMLKPAISSHELQIIGATTLDEYRTHLEKDPALERRLQPIVVKEPSAQETRSILGGIKDRFEAHHQVLIPDEVLDTAIYLADRYLSQRFFPDKAIDIIDEAAAHLRATRTKMSAQSRREHIERSLRDVQKHKEQAVEEEHYGEALILKKEEEKLIRSLDAFSGSTERTPQKLAISVADVERVVSRMAGVPLEDMTLSEQEKLMDLEKALRRSIVGQDYAIEHVSSALRRARVGVSSEARPMGSFLFVGPSGVGKSELAKVLARTFFGQKDALIKLDMSEFSEPHTVSKMLGAPAGYVGYEDHGTFIERVRRTPHALILFDEIEKAHSQIHNILLQVLEDGELTDNKGVRVSFRNTLIVLTSNIGTAHFFEDGAGPGFGPEKEGERESGAQTELRETFRPELLSRLDEIIFFKPLRQKDVEKIVRRELKKLASRMTRKHVNISFDASLVRHIARLSGSERHGARKVRTTVQRIVETELAEGLIKGTLTHESKVRIGAKDGEITYAA